MEYYIATDPVFVYAGAGCILCSRRFTIKLVDCSLTGMAALAGCGAWIFQPCAFGMGASYSERVLVYDTSIAKQSHDNYPGSVCLGQASHVFRVDAVLPWTCSGIGNLVVVAMGCVIARFLQQDSWHRRDDDEGAIWR